MNKREACRRRLEARIGDPAAVEQLLLSDCGLPGPRANLQLAAACADALAARTASGEWWTVLLGWIDLGSLEAPSNHPREFLPFVAAQALGALHARADGPQRTVALARLRRAARDPRWRLREGVAFGLQRIAENDFAALESIAEAWLAEGSALEWRAVLVALAHPPLLLEEQAGYALEVADRLWRRFAAWSPQERKADDAAALRKALELAPSVLVAASPDGGFALLGRWAGAEELDLKKVVAANLRKARLARAFPDRVEEVGEVLSQSWD